VDPHLVHIPCLASLAAGGLPRRDLQRLGRQAHGTLDAQVLGFGALEELGAHFLEGLHFATGEGYADLVDFLKGEREMVSGPDGGCVGRNLII
jgi:hypothetical protein